MTSRKKKAELENLCKQKGIQLNPNIKYTKEKLVNLLGQKTLENGLATNSWGLEERRKLFPSGPMLCQWYKRLKKEQKEIVMTDDNNWVAERKFNGCFEWHTPILLSDGTTLPIGYIVDNKLPVEVMSYDVKIQQLVPKKVVNWFNNGRKKGSDWCKLSYQPRRGKQLTVTKNHNIYTKNRGWVEAASITENDTLVYCSSNPKIEVYDLGIKKQNSEVYYSSYVAYDLEVEDTHCYFANNILVHNCRICIFYHPDWGFQFFSRHTSDVNFLPIEYSNLLINDKNNFYQGKDFINRYNFPFILDSEVITTNKELDLSILPRNAHKLFGANIQPDFVIKSELNSACAILQYNNDDSFLLQKQNPMIFQVFDVMMINNQYLYNEPLYKRLNILKQIMKYLPTCFRPCELVKINKMGYFENIVTNENAEGIVLKNLNSIYNTAGTRHADKWVKLKRSLDSIGGLEKDIDAFVTGFTPGLLGTRNESLVGSLEFSVYLMDKNGLTRPHVIANISGFSDEFRKLISTKDEYGNVALKEEMYNKVFAINGHTVSAVNLRFNHAILVSEYPRLDKNYYQCDFPEEVLRNAIL